MRWWLWIGTGALLSTLLCVVGIETNGQVLQDRSLEWMVSPSTWELPESAGAVLEGSPKPQRPGWIILTIGALFAIFAVLRALFPADVQLLFRAYIDHTLLGQINKEDRLLNSWPSILFFLLCGFSIALLGYLGMVAGVFQPVHPDLEPSYLGLSVVVMMLFGLKIAVLRLVGFLFDIWRYLRKYVTILYLGFFNAGWLALLFAAVLSLVPYSHANWLMWAAAGVFGSIFLFRVLQVVGELLSNYRFPKFYLIVYLCTLEIAPVLILFKVLYR